MGAAVRDAGCGFARTGWVQAVAFGPFVDVESSNTLFELRNDAIIFPWRKLLATFMMYPRGEICVP
jgi:hypothetical protein